MIYDPPVVDELSSIAKISGIPEIPRKSLFHALNMRAMAIKSAKSMGGCQYQDINIIIAHLGGGITISIHEKGRIVDIIRDDEGPFHQKELGISHVMI